ncbi:MAG: sulfatase-like hydrolase/transferase [Planctomycetaceae bacterium]|nr:sulfatase-like hydrolase/transferase [Planctomycetales bacterium]MCB9939047.1 sulfatase-like hydrolase/transferase [Planctomycetaceae bacterium]
MNKATLGISLLILSVCATLLYGDTEPVDNRPNILWIVTDDQRVDSIAAFNRIRHGRSDSSLGHVLSPNIDRLATMGTTFINTFNQNPGCAPSRTLMHTGRYSHRTGVYGFEYYNPTGQAHWRPMVPEILRDKAGYQTLAVGKLGIRAQHSANQKGGTEPPLYETNLGYRKEFAAKGLVDWNSETKWSGGQPGPKNETFFFADGTRLIWPENPDGMPNDRAEIQRRLDLLREYTPGDDDKNGSILGGVNPQPGDRTRDGSFTGALLDHLAHAGEPLAVRPRASARQHQELDGLRRSAYAGKHYTDMLGRKQNGPASDKPLFAYVGFEFPHTPVLPPADIREKFQKLKYEIPEFTKEELAAFPPQLLKLYKNSQSDHFTDAEKHQMIADYYAFCAYGDSLVGRAVDGFIEFSEKQKRPWLILYVCGDHGWRLNEHGMVSKFSHYDTDLHNPLIVISSDKEQFPAGKVVTDFTCFVDMAPTFLAAAGIDISTPEYEYLDGRDLAKTATGALSPRDYIIAEPTWVIGPRAVIRTKGYKFAMKIRPRAGHTMTAATAGKDFKWAVTADLKDIEPTLFDLRSDPDEIHNVAFDERYRPVLGVLRAKLQDIVLGDGRVEVAWTKQGGDKVHISDYSPGADDDRIELPALPVQAVNRK